MKIKHLFFLPLLLILLLSAFRMMDDIISRLGLEQQTARQYILSNLIGSFETGPMETTAEDDGSTEDSYQQMKSFRIPYARLLPAIVKGDKAEAARELCAYIKMYVNSSDFMDDYKKRRESAKPTSEPWRPDADMIEGQRKSVKDMEKQLVDLKKQKGIAPEIITAFEKSLKDQKNSLADWEDPHPNLTRWEKSYPENPAPIVKQRLQDYLALAASVDFNAALMAPDKYKRIKFVNPAYEKKPLKWKACFRAGKEVNDVVTAFVKEWVKGEIISAVKSKMPAQNSETTNAVQKKEPVPIVSNEPKADSVNKPVKEKKSLLNKLKKATGF